MQRAQLRAYLGSTSLYTTVTTTEVVAGRTTSGIADCSAASGLVLPMLTLNV
jgi:hypothetical protein